MTDDDEQTEEPEEEAQDEAQETTEDQPDPQETKDDAKQERKFGDEHPPSNRRKPAKQEQQAITNVNLRLF